jgi:hypothetical protein
MWSPNDVILRLFIVPSILAFAETPLFWVSQSEFWAIPKRSGT